MMFLIIVLAVIAFLLFLFTRKEKEASLRERRIAHFNDQMKMTCDTCGFERTPESFATEFESTPYRYWFGTGGKSYCPDCTENIHLK